MKKNGQGGASGGLDAAVQPGSAEPSQDAASLLQALQRVARIGCVEIDDGQVRAPQGIAALLGLKRAPRFVDELVGGMTETSAGDFLSRMVDKGHAPFELEVEIAGDGGQRWLRAVRDASSPRLVVFQDVTDIRRARDEVLRLNASLERRVQRRTRQLQATNRELETFAYSVSHDLKAPLAAIDGFAHVLEQTAQRKLDPMESSYLDRIRSSVRHMFGLIDALLELSEISTRSRIDRQPVDVTQLVADIAAELREREPDRQVRLRVDRGIRVYADPPLFAIALRNLLDNAWKFTRDSAQPSVEVRLDKEAPPGIISIVVRDNGAGFDGTRASKLFAPFQRMHRKSEFPGTGIGLATVQRIVHRHGGTLRVWAETGVGAAFYVSLPHAEAGPPESSHY